MRPTLEDARTAVVRTPFGRVRLTASADALIRVGWCSPSSMEQPSRSALRERPVLAAAVDQLEAFAAAERRVFDLPLDFGTVDGFYRRVLELLSREVPFGSTVTYGQLAAQTGNAKAARAVGTAMNRNPLPIVVPCHRVLSSTGIGGFAPGVDVKRLLLRHEGVAI